MIGAGCCRRVHKSACCSNKITMEGAKAIGKLLRFVQREYVVILVAMVWGV